LILINESAPYRFRCRLTPNPADADSAQCGVATAQRRSHRRNSILSLAAGHEEAAQYAVDKIDTHNETYNKGG
jgi:hypothetical protein